MATHVIKAGNANCSDEHPNSTINTLVIINALPTFVMPSTYCLVSHRLELLPSHYHTLFKHTVTFILCKLVAVNNQVGRV